MINLVYTSCKGGFTQTWDLCEGLLEACQEEGILGYAWNKDKDDFVNDPNLMKYPVLVPANHYQPFFEIPEHLRHHKWIRLESESHYNQDGNEVSYSKWMEKCSRDYSEIYTFSFDDKNDYFGRRVRFQFPFLSDTIFKPVDCKQRDTILMFGTQTDARKKLLADCGNIIESRRSEHKHPDRDNAIELNKLVNEHKYLLCQTATVARMIAGKVFYGLAAKKLVFIEENPFVQYAKWVIEPNIHAVYFKDWEDLVKKYAYYQSNSNEYERISENGHKLFLENFTTKLFVRRVDKECGVPVEEHQTYPQAA